MWTFLSSAGHEAHHWISIGSPSAPDAELMTYALENRLIVFTHDLDFGALLATSGGRGPSVVQLREQNVDPLVIGRAVVDALVLCEDDLRAGALVTISLRKMRATLLPLPIRNIA